MPVVQKVQKISGKKAFGGVQFDKTFKITYITIYFKNSTNLEKFTHGNLLKKCHLKLLHKFWCSYNESSAQEYQWNCTYSSI